MPKNFNFSENLRFSAFRIKNGGALFFSGLRFEKFLQGEKGRPFIVWEEDRHLYPPINNVNAHRATRAILSILKKFKNSPDNVILIRRQLNGLYQFHWKIRSEIFPNSRRPPKSTGPRAILGRIFIPPHPREVQHYEPPKKFLCFDKS